MATRSKTSSRASRSWKDIPQEGMRRASTATAKRRRLMLAAKVMGGVFVCAAVIAAFVLSLFLIRDNHARLSFSQQEERVISLVFETDGVLQRRWLEDWFVSSGRSLRGIDLREIDLRSLRHGLESIGQVREAQVAVRLPTELRITLRERQPIVRVRTAGIDGRPRDYLVADDGYVYEGYGYPSESLQRLPYLDGVRLIRQGNGFRPIPGMDTVGELLEMARVETPEIYRTWRVVSCAQFYGNPHALNAVIRVRGSMVDETVFLPHGFSSQLERLRQVVRHAHGEGVRRLHRVDLSLDSRAVVQVVAPETTRAASRRR